MVVVVAVVWRPSCLEPHQGLSRVWHTFLRRLLSDLAHPPAIHKTCPPAPPLLPALRGETPVAPCFPSSPSSIPSPPSPSRLASPLSSAAPIHPIPPSGLKWRFSASKRANCLPHPSQTCFLTLKCSVSWCLLASCARAKAFPQPGAGHLKGRSSACERKWERRLNCRVN